MYDHLTLAELNERIMTGEIKPLELPDWQLSAWAAWEPEPVPFSSFTLSDPQHRQEFLHQYCYVGEPALFAAVAHIWDSLAEPRASRCTQMGLASGSGGTGKIALLLMLQKLLAECLAINPVLPDKVNYASLDEWHQAVMDHFASGEEQERALCQHYAAILDGTASPEAAAEPQLPGKSADRLSADAATGSANDEI